MTQAGPPSSRTFRPFHAIHPMASVLPVKAAILLWWAVWDLPIRHYGESTRREVWASGGTRSPFRLAVAIFSIPTFVRLVRGNTLALKRQTFVEAARSTADRGIPFGAGGLLPKVPGFLAFPLSHNAFYIM